MLSRVNYSLTQLEYVLAVHRHGHFARAAEACHVTQPTLSMQIQKLEESLGVTIFDRSKKPILLTEVGQKLIEQMQSVLSEANRIDDIIRASQAGRLEGVLRVGIIPTIAPYLLPLLLPKIEMLHPGLRLKILELQTDQIVAALGSDEIDTGILATPLKIPRLFERPLYYEYFSVLCNKGHPLSKSRGLRYTDLKPDDLWLLQEGHCLRHQMLDVCTLKTKTAQERRFQFESGSLETLKNLIAAYGGYTLLPSLAQDRLSPQTELVEFAKPAPAREIGLALRREHHKKDLVNALAESILEAIPEEIRKIKKKDLDLIAVS